MTRETAYRLVKSRSLSRSRWLYFSALLSLILSLGCGGAQRQLDQSTLPSQSAYPLVGRYTPIYMLKQYAGESEQVEDMSRYGDDADQAKGESYEADEHEEPVYYWNDEERSAHIIRVKSGLIVDRAGSPLDPQLDLPEHKSRGGEAIFVMDVMGNIYYSFDPKYGHIHHSSLAAGRPVAAAGELVIINGELISISNESGHYRPPASTIDLALGRFKELGVKIDKVKRFELLPKKDAPEPERLGPSPL